MFVSDDTYFIFALLVQFVMRSILIYNCKYFVVNYHCVYERREWLKDELIDDLNGVLEFIISSFQENVSPLLTMIDIVPPLRMQRC